MFKRGYTLILLGLVLLVSKNAYLQIPQAGELVGVHVLSNSDMNNIANPIQGSLVFNSDRNSVFQYNGSGWTNLKPEVYFGKFIITTTGEKIIAGLPFKPSRISFVAHANIESYILNADNEVSNNYSGLANSFGSMNGYVRDDIGGVEEQVIYLGGSGNSINDISRYASDEHCIGIRYGNQNGDNLGLTTAQFVSFDSNGFRINVDNKADNLVVIFQAYE